jgi:hypothetical protein
LYTFKLRADNGIAKKNPRNAGFPSDFRVKKVKPMQTQLAMFKLCATAIDFPNIATPSMWTLQRNRFTAHFMAESVDRTD